MNVAHSLTIEGVTWFLFFSRRRCRSFSDGAAASHSESSCIAQATLRPFRYGPPMSAVGLRGDGDCTGSGNQATRLRVRWSDAYRHFDCFETPFDGFPNFSRRVLAPINTAHQRRITLQRNCNFRENPSVFFEYLFLLGLAQFFQLGHDDAYYSRNCIDMTTSRQVIF